VLYGLAAPIHNRDLSTAFRVMEQIASGIVYINVGAEWKSAHIDYSRRLQSRQIDR